jgi:hypothetical protein
MKTLGIIETSNPVESIHSHLKYSKILIIAAKNSLEIINLNNLSLIDVFELPGTLKMMFKEFFVITNDDRNHVFDYDQIFYGKIYINNSIKIDEEKFICKVNSFKPHLFYDPYILPCKNSACIECIYQNFNIHKQTFKCNYVKCKTYHNFNNHPLVPNLEISKMIKTDLKIIAVKTIDRLFIEIINTGIY